MKRLICLLILIAGLINAQAQTLLESQYKNLSGLEKDLQQAKTPEQKTNALISLFIHHSLHNEAFNKKAAMEYQQQLEIFTHQTGDPELIAKALFALIRPAVNVEKKKRINRLYEYAKLNNLDFYKSLSKIRDAEYLYSFQPDQSKASQILNEAINTGKNLNDSLRTFIILDAAYRFNSINNHLQALQLGFQANEMASKMKSWYLLRVSNNLLANVYYELENHSKAIYYDLKELELLRKLGNTHTRAIEHAGTARNYFVSDQPVLGKYHVEEAYRLADSVKGSKRLFNQITGTVIVGISISQNAEALTDFLKKYRQHFFIMPGSEFLDNLTLSFAHSTIGNFDSARFFINRTGEYFSDKIPVDNRKKYFYVLATIASHEMDWNFAVENYKKSLAISIAQNNVSDCIIYTDSLKNILAKQNLYSEAYHYSTLGDSLQSELAKQLDKEDITKQEVAALEKEKEIQAIAKEKEKQQRHNLQYLGITFGVVALFITLLLMGLFQVSPKTIKIISFFSFLLFFEFIFLIFKKQITFITDGEPLMDLLFMVLLAAVMVPLHHWGEKKVVEYLSTKKLSFSNRKPSKKIIVAKEVAG